MAVIVHGGVCLCVSGCRPAWLWRVSDVRTGPFQRQMVPCWCIQAIFQRAQSQTGGCQWTSVDLLLPPAQLWRRGGRAAGRQTQRFYRLCQRFCLGGDQAKARWVWRVKAFYHNAKKRIRIVCDMMSYFLNHTGDVLSRLMPLQMVSLADVFTVALLIAPRRWMCGLSVLYDVLC